MSPATVNVELPERYEADHHIANGGMGAVWAARDCVLRRVVAIKLLAPHLAEEQRAVRRFMREARAAATLSSHPHVITIFDVGEYGGRPFIVMEHMAGGPLSASLRGGRPRLEDAVRWLGEAAAALDVAHERGIVHRDVKPHNLLLDERGRLGVADFGIARLAWETSVTQTGQVLGTAAYISPEQARGEPATEASDRYSLAVVAYELLAGRKPFVGDHFAAQARAHVEDDPPPATALAPGLRPAVDGVLQRGLSKDPEARWPTASAFVEALRRAAGERASERVVVPTAPTRLLPRRPSMSPPPRSRARPRRLLPLAALLAVLAAGAIAFALAAGDEGGAGGRQASRSQPGAGRSPGAPRSAPEAGSRGAGDASPAAGAASPGAGAASSAAGTGSVADLNARGFELMNEGRYGEAIPQLQQAVQRCGDSRETVCAYALYNLGHSLRLAGRPAEAVPVLERRLSYDNQTEVVQAELDAARREAGRG